MKCSVIIVAAGQGLRFKSKIPKPFVLLNKSPLFVHSLTVFERCINIDNVIIVGQGEFLGRIKKIAGKYKKVRAIVSGGQTRSDSVRCGLKAITWDCDDVLVHDAARPFIDQAMLSRVLTELIKSPAVITAVPVKATIKEVEMKSMRVKRTLPRCALYEVQTPQGFKRSLLEKAHAQKFHGEATDCAMLVEHLGVTVKVVMGDYRNIKITTPEDLLVAKALI